MTWVEVVIVVVFIAVLTTTVVAAMTKTETVSQTLLRWSRMHSWFAYLMGALMGHWFFPGAPGIAVWPWLLVPMAVFGALDVVNAFYPFPGWLRYPGIYVLVGIPAGAFLWVQG